jgi:hypothetical protein
LRDVAAIVVDIAVVEPKSRALLSNITGLAATLVDVPFDPVTYQVTVQPGQLLAQWRTAVDGNASWPRPVLSGIRLYERFIYLSPPVQ